MKNKEEDVYQEIIDSLSKELSDNIDEQILFEITGMNKEEREIHFNRIEKIDDLLDNE